MISNVFYGGLTNYDVTLHLLTLGQVEPSPFGGIEIPEWGAFGSPVDWWPHPWSLLKKALDARVASPEYGKQSKDAKHLFVVCCCCCCCCCCCWCCCCCCCFPENWRLVFFGGKISAISPTDCGSAWISELQVPGPGMYDHQRTKTMRPNRRRGDLHMPPQTPTTHGKNWGVFLIPQIWVK